MIIYVKKNWQMKYFNYNISDNFYFTNTINMTGDLSDNRSLESTWGETRKKRFLEQAGNYDNIIGKVFWDGTTNTLYQTKIVEARNGSEKAPEITKDVVKKGIQFIYDNQDMEQEELIDKLIELGCFFTLQDIKDQYPERLNTSTGDLRKRYPDSKDWPTSYYTCYWANLIANAMVDCQNRVYIQGQEMFLIPHYIRMLSRDDEEK